MITCAVSIMGTIGAVMPFAAIKQVFASDNVHYVTLAVVVSAVSTGRAVAPREPIKPVSGRGSAAWALHEGQTTNHARGRG